MKIFKAALGATILTLVSVIGGTSGAGADYQSAAVTVETLPPEDEFEFVGITQMILENEIEDQVLTPMLDELVTLWEAEVDATDSLGTSPEELDVYYAWLGAYDTTSCGLPGQEEVFTRSNNPGPFYCWSTNEIVVPLNFVAVVLKAELGDVAGEVELDIEGLDAIWYTLAHEFGHRMQAAFYEEADLIGVDGGDLEEHADCLAGYATQRIGWPADEVFDAAEAMLDTYFEPDADHAPSYERMDIAWEGFDLADRGVPFGLCATEYLLDLIES